MNNAETKDGSRQRVSSSKVWGLVFIDLMFSTVSLSFVIEVLKLIDLTIPQWVAAMFGLLVFLYPLLAFRGVVISIGRWSHGVIRYPCADIEGYSDKGVLFIIDNVPKKILTKRTVILVLYFATMFLLMTAMQDYS